MTDKVETEIVEVNLTGDEIAALLYKEFAVIEDGVLVFTDIGNAWIQDWLEKENAKLNSEEHF